MKGHILNDSICTKYSQKANLYRWKIDGYLSWGGSGVWLQMGTGDYFPVMGMFFIWILVMAQLYTFSKNHWLAHSRWAHLMVCNLYLNNGAKTLKKKKIFKRRGCCVLNAAGRHAKKKTEEDTLSICTLTRKVWPLTLSIICLLTLQIAHMHTRWLRTENSNKKKEKENHT